MDSQGHNHGVNLERGDYLIKKDLVLDGLPYPAPYVGHELTSLLPSSILCFTYLYH